MKMKAGLIAITAAALAFPVAAADQATPAVVGAVYQCRSVADNAARLACFDAAAAELEKAQTARTLVFGDENDFPHFEGAELKSTIGEVHPNKAGRYVFTLADGSRWLQTDKTEAIFPPKAGDTIVLRRGLVGNYRAKTRGTLFQVRQIG